MYNYGTPFSAPRAQDAYNRTPLASTSNFYNNSPNMYSALPDSYHNISVASSGYCSPGSSFNNSPSFNSYYQPAYNFSTIPTYHTASPSYSSVSAPVPISVQRPVKRARDESTDFLLDDIFQNNQVQKVSKPSKKQKRELNPSNESLNMPTSSEVFGSFDLDENDENDESVCTVDGKKRILTRDQRTAANQRERKRMNIMNGAFNDLRASLPISTGRKRRKMSRLDIVIGAMEYIDYLNALLETPGNGPLEINFEAYQNKLYMLD